MRLVKLFKIIGREIYFYLKGVGYARAAAFPGKRSRGADRGHCYSPFYVGCVYRDECVRHQREPHESGRD